MHTPWHVNTQNHLITHRELRTQALLYGKCESLVATIGPKQTIRKVSNAKAQT